MKYNYRAGLELQHISLGDRLASYWNPDESGMVLVEEEDFKYHDDGKVWVVVDFDKDGFANNAQSFYSYEDVWDFFYQCIKDCRAERLNKTDTPKYNEDANKILLEKLS